MATHFSVWILTVNFYYKSTTNFTFPDSRYTLHVKYLKSLLKILDLQNGVFSPLDGAADQCASGHTNES